MKRLPIHVASVIALAASAVGMSACKQHNRAAKLSIDHLDFMQGHWSGDVFDGTGKETWLEPGSGTMLGMFKHTKDNATTFSEFFIIEETDEGVFFRFKHFNNDYTTWEEVSGVDPVEFKLFSVEKNTAVFHGHNERSPEYIRYMLTDTGQLAIKMISRTDKKGSDGHLEVLLDRLN